MSIGNYILQRCLYGLAMVLAVVVLNFLILKLAPGDAADVLIAMSGVASDQQAEAIRKSLGLDKGIAAQLATYLLNMAQGNLGKSLYFGSSVNLLIVDRIPATLVLLLPSLVLATTFGVVLGSFAASHREGAASHAVNVLSLAGFAMPVFWSGIMLLIAFSYYMPLFPTSGMTSFGVSNSAFQRVVDIAHHSVLPIVSLTFVTLAQYTRQARASMITALGTDYVRTARAKGLRPFAVVYVHALRNAVIPIVTIVGLQFSHALAGAVLVETVFNWPGLGRLAFDAVLNRDFPLLLGILLYSAILVVVVNILTDFVYRVVDPRIRIGAEA